MICNSNTHTHTTLTMGIWNTNNGNKYNVNIKPGLVSAMRAKGARFCWFRDNPGINNESDNTYYEDVTSDNETHRKLREGITVVCEDGESLVGYVTHYVSNESGQTTGTNISDWFIFQPGTYPTHYIIQYSVDEDDVHIEEL